MENFLAGIRILFGGVGYGGCVRRGVVIMMIVLRIMASHFIRNISDFDSASNYLIICRCFLRVSDLRLNYPQK